MVLMKLIKREKKIVIIAVCNFVLINFREKMAPTKPIAKLGKCVGVVSQQQHYLTFFLCRTEMPHFY